MTSVEQGTVLPSFRDRETFSLSSAPSFAYREGIELHIRRMGWRPDIMEAMEFFSMASFFRKRAFQLERTWLGRRILTGVFFPQLHITSLIQGVFQANGIFFFQKVWSNKKNGLPLHSLNRKGVANVQKVIRCHSSVGRAKD